MKSFLSVGVLAAALLSSAGVGAAQPQVENRAPEPGEIGYLPPHGEPAQFNPPSLAWLHEKPAQTYTVEWSRHADFSQAVTITNLPFNCYTHYVPLEPGEYYWRYRFVTARGEISTWSHTRRFILDGNAIVFPMPSREERRARVPASHPRLFVRPEELPRLRAAAAQAQRREFDRLRAQADRLLGQPLVPEPTERGTATIKTNLTLLQNWWANRVQTLRACEEAETVAFVYLITGERKYGEEARRRILDLAAWNPDGETNFRWNCEAAKPLLHRLSRAYDWAWAALTESDRARVQAAVQRRVRDAWESGEVGRGVGHINRPLNSHGNRTWHKIGESGIVFLGEIPEADLWLDYALNKFYACYPVWSDADGGWHEGLSYWGGYMSKAVWWLQAAKTALNVDGFKKPFFSHVGDYALYMAPPGAGSMGFGDLSGRTPPASWGGHLEFFERNAAGLPGSNARYWRWWGEQWKLEPQDGILGFLYRANLPALPQPQAPADLPASKIFHGIGVASLHTTLLSAKEDVHFLFKSSPFGSLSHGHNAQNGFQLTAYGETLLPACVYRDYHGSQFHLKWVHQTVSQNALLIDGKGQIPHSGEAQGRIAAYELHPRWDYVCGDATRAYGGRVERALRHVVFVKPDMIVLCDEVTAGSPVTCQLMLHGLSPFELDAPRQRLQLRRPKAGVLVQYLAPEALTFKQWDGFTPKPMRGDFPNHWHVEAATPKPDRSLALLTVLAPYRGANPPALEAQRLETTSAVGVQATVGGRKVLVAFRKAGVSGPAKLQGIEFDHPVLVQGP